MRKSLRIRLRLRRGIGSTCKNIGIHRDVCYFNTSNMVCLVLNGNWNEAIGRMIQMIKIIS